MLGYGRSAPLITAAECSYSPWVRGERMISGLEENPRGISGLGGSGSEDRRGNVRTFCHRGYMNQRSRALWKIHPKSARARMRSGCACYEEMRRERERAPEDALEDAQGSSLVVRFMPGIMQSAKPDHPSTIYAERESPRTPSRIQAEKSPRRREDASSSRSREARGCSRGRCGARSPRAP